MMAWDQSDKQMFDQLWLSLLRQICMLGMDIFRINPRALERPYDYLSESDPMYLHEHPSIRHTILLDISLMA